MLFVLKHENGEKYVRVTGEKLGQWNVVDTVGEATVFDLALSPDDCNQFVCSPPLPFDEDERCLQTKYRLKAVKVRFVEEI